MLYKIASDIASTLENKTIQPTPEWKETGVIKAGITLNSSNISLAKKFDMEGVLELVEEDDVKSTL